MTPQSSETFPEVVAEKSVPTESKPRATGTAASKPAGMSPLELMRLEQKKRAAASGAPPHLKAKRNQMTKMAMHLTRRGHLYAGLLLLPWVFLYGATGFLFNHPEVWPDTASVAITKNHTQGTEVASLPKAADLAAEVVALLNAQGKDQYTLFEPEKIAFGRGGYSASITSKDEKPFNVSLMSNGTGIIREGVVRGGGVGTAAVGAAASGTAPNQGREGGSFERRGRSAREGAEGEPSASTSPARTAAAGVAAAVDSSAMDAGKPVDAVPAEKAEAAEKVEENLKSGDTANAGEIPKEGAALPAADGPRPGGEGGRRRGRGGPRGGEDRQGGGEMRADGERGPAMGARPEGRGTAPGRGEGGFGGGRGEGFGGEQFGPPAPFAVESGLHLKKSPIDAMRNALPEVLNRVKMDGAIVTAVRLSPLSFIVEGGGKKWNVSYNAESGSVSGREAAPEQSGTAMSFRRFLLRLHMAHGYPAEDVGMRWLWAVLVDCTSLIMVFWGISGIIMWWQIKRTRLLGGACLLVSTVAATYIGIGMHELITAAGR